MTDLVLSLGMLCGFARVTSFSDSVKQYSANNFKYVWLEFHTARYSEILCMLTIGLLATTSL
jgi:hypothetical protein